MYSYIAYIQICAVKKAFCNVPPTTALELYLGTPWCSMFIFWKESQHPASLAGMKMNRLWAHSLVQHLYSTQQQPDLWVSGFEILLITYRDSDLTSTSKDKIPPWNKHRSNEFLKRVMIFSWWMVLCFPGMATIHWCKCNHKDIVPMPFT